MICDIPFGRQYGTIEGCRDTLYKAVSCRVWCQRNEETWALTDRQCQHASLLILKQKNTRISNSKHHDEPKPKLVLYKAVLARLQNANGSFRSRTDFLQVLCCEYISIRFNTHQPDPGQAILEEFDRVSDPETETHDL